jgi:hypothetical protein
MLVQAALEKFPNQGESIRRKKNGRQIPWSCNINYSQLHPAALNRLQHGHKAFAEESRLLADD